MQCVAQKGGVISNPAEREKATQDAAAPNGGGRALPSKVQAHPIVGWKGFEDVLPAIPGETFDIIQKMPGGTAVMTTLREFDHSFLALSSLTGRQVKPRNNRRQLSYSSSEDAHIRKLLL